MRGANERQETAGSGAGTSLKEKSMKCVTLVKCAVLLAVLIAVASPASAQQAVLDHFRCYSFPLQPATGIRVGMQDLFPPGLQTTLEITPGSFCNAVQKTVNGVVTPIVNPNHHFVLYSTPVPTTGFTVTVSNQFGTQTMGVSTPAMLVPAGIVPLLPSADLDHFRCYVGQQITSFAPRTVILQDSLLTETVTVQQPVMLCNPMIKTHNGNVTGILHPDVHLTCFQTSKSIFPGGSVNLQDQFLTELVNPENYPIRPPDMLCVPSLLVSWSVGVAQ
jgi:hypothetical protein